MCAWRGDLTDEDHPSTHRPHLRSTIMLEPLQDLQRRRNLRASTAGDVLCTLLDVHTKPHDGSEILALLLSKAPCLMSLTQASVSSAVTA